MKQIILITILSFAFPIIALSAVPWAVPTPDARPVSYISSTTAVLNWQTTEPCETILQLREGNYIAGTPGYEDVWKKAKEIKGSKEKSKSHFIVLTGLKPATRYFYRVYDPAYKPQDEKAEKNERIWSYEPPYRREYAFNTMAKPGEKAIIRIPVKVLIAPNIINLDTVKADTPKPEPMTEKEIQLYKDEMEKSVLFYWVNSGMMYWLDLTFFIEPEWLKVGAEKEDLDAFYKGWQNARDALRVFDPLDISNHSAGFPLKDKTIYYGQVIVNCVRQWNEEKKQWEYQGSGGWTFGIDWMQWDDKSQRPAPGRSGFLGGSDIAWLLTHEYHHQKESQHHFSGLTSEYDRVVFCHFAPKYKSPMGHNWTWDTAFDHGEHWDGIAWELRALTTTQYLRNMFGYIYVAKDTDGDGIPDEDSKLPLDEKRFGSDPKKAGTDGSGMTDLEKVMMAKWVPTLLTNSRTKMYNPGYVPMCKMASGKDLQVAGEGYAYPKATALDSDGDGIIDKEDDAPIYPWQTKIRQATINVDADVADWTEIPSCGSFKVEGLEFTVKTAYDRENLYYMMQVTGDTRGITLNIDGDDDGWYVGNDNLDIRINPGNDGNFIIERAVAHLCAEREWPHFDEGRPSERINKIKVMKEGKEETVDDKWSFATKKRFGTKDDIKIASGRDGNASIIEIAIANATGVFPIQIGPNHTFSHAIYVGVPEKGAIPVYEGYHLFKLTAE